jgi:hypothetical protein
MQIAKDVPDFRVNLLYLSSALQILRLRSGMWHHKVWHGGTNASEELAVFFVKGAKFDFAMFWVWYPVVSKQVLSFRRKPMELLHPEEGKERSRFLRNVTYLPNSMKPSSCWLIYWHGIFLIKEPEVVLRINRRYCRGGLRPIEPIWGSRTPRVRGLLSHGTFAH